MGLRSLSLTVWILIGFALGILVGLVFGDLCSNLKTLSDVFVKIWQITILPSVVLSLITGIGSLKRDNARPIAMRAGLVLLLFWVLGVSLFFSFQLAFPPREVASFFSTQDLAGTTNVSIIDQFIPSNPFQSLSDGVIPAIVVFSLFLGFALMMDDGSGPILHLFKTLLEAFTRMTRILSRTFPVGVFIITATTAGTITFEGFLDIQVYLITLAVVTVLLSLLILPLLVTCVTTFRYRDIIAVISRALLLALSTGSEFITLPLIIESVRRLFNGPTMQSSADPHGGGDKGRCSDISKTDRCADAPEPSRDEGAVRSFSEILVPVAYTFPLLGALTPFLFILFVAWLYKNPLDLFHQLQLIAVGIPTFFGSSKISVISLLNLMHLPSDAYNLYISMGILRQSFVAALSCMSIFSFTVICIALITDQSRIRWRRVILSFFVILLLVILLIGGLKMGFALLLANTYHGTDRISQMELPLGQDGKRVDDNITTSVYLCPEDVPPLTIPDDGGGDDIQWIQKRGALRVGYNRNNVPFVFINGKGDLVGYDVQMAYDLARFVNVTRVEFVPITGTTLAESLNSGYCDIVMSSVMVTSDRLTEMKFTDPYSIVHMSFVVPDERKGVFSKFENVKKMKGLRVAIFNNTALVPVAAQALPEATIVPIDSYQEFFEDKKADALFIPAEEGYALTLLYPFYDVSIIEPNDLYQVMYGYPVAQNSSQSYLTTLNYWLKMEKSYGNLDEKYDYWILGKNASATEPRWSVVRDVLHWVS